MQNRPFCNSNVAYTKDLPAMKCRTARSAISLTRNCCLAFCPCADTTRSSALCPCSDRVVGAVSVFGPRPRNHNHRDPNHDQRADNHHHPIITSVPITIVIPT